MKKAAALAALALIAFFAVVFSTFYGVKGTKITPNSDSESKITLTFMNSWGGYDTKASTVEQLFDEFQKKEKNIEVVNHTLSGDDFLPTIKDKFATGRQPDVFGLWPGSDIRTLIKAGKVADLTELVTSDPNWYNSFEKSMWSQVMQDGKIYGLPVEITFEGLFINKDLFDRYNVKVPQNYEDLKKAVITFKKNNIIPIAYNSKPEGSYLYQNIVMSLDGKNVENPFVNGRIRYSYIKSMYIMRELHELGAFPNDDECFTMESNARDDLFVQKKAAMIVQGSWFINKCRPETVELVPFPRMSDSSPNAAVYCLGCGTFYISQKAWNDPEKKEAAIKLLRFLTSKSTCEKLAVQTDMVSCVKIDENKIKYNKLTKSGLKMVKDASVLVGAPDSYIKRSVWEEVIISYFPDMLCNKLSPEELWDMAIKVGAEEK